MACFIILNFSRLVLLHNPGDKAIILVRWMSSDRRCKKGLKNKLHRLQTLCYHFNGIFYPRVLYMFSVILWITRQFLIVISVILYQDQSVVNIVKEFSKKCMYSVSDARMLMPSNWVEDVAFLLSVTRRIHFGRWNYFYHLYCIVLYCIVLYWRCGHCCPIHCELFRSIVLPRIWVLGREYAD